MRGIGSRRNLYVALSAMLISAGLVACGNSATSSQSSAATSSGGNPSPVSSGTGTSSSGSTGSSGGGSSTPGNSTKSVTLSWTPPAKNSDGTPLALCAPAAATGSCLAGYTLHYGTTSQDYTGSIQITDPSTTSYVVNDTTFPAGTYYFAISAYNGVQISSPMSGELTVTID